MTTSTSIRTLARAFVTLMPKAPHPQLVQALAQEIVARKLTHRLNSIVKEIEREVLRQSGHMEATVISAHTLSPELKQEIERFIRNASASPLKTLTLHETVDSTLTGGITLQTPEWNVDLSVHHLITQLEAQWK
jgi:F0F1-type ATP synthase delta subunit